VPEVEDDVAVWGAVELVEAPAGMLEVELEELVVELVVEEPVAVARGVASVEDRPASAPDVAPAAPTLAAE
jgi:hypothetical protein